MVVIATVAGLAITGSACVWQYQRGRERDRVAEEAERAARDAVVSVGDAPVTEPALRFRRVSVRGTLLPATTVLLDNQNRGSQTGYVVFSALQLPGGGHVLVKRGWIAGSADRSRTPDVRTPAGQVELEGIALPPNRRFLELSTDRLEKSVWQNVTVERFTARFRLEFQPFILEQTSAIDDGLLRDWPRPASGSAKNYGYAFQWGAMFLTILGLHVHHYLRRRTASRPA